MNAYTVTWIGGALEMLGEIWLANAPQRRAITHASNEIERRLAASPMRYGEPLSEGLFVIEIQPLRFLFQVYDSDRRVEIVAVRLLER